MKYAKIVLTGGNGYLGNVLTNYYKTIATQVVILSRKAKAAEGNVETVLWDGNCIGPK